MATEQTQEHADWRARQKERERERRRMRDRQRRQSMSVEEREKHLARRRRNYQLRRQRAATAHFGSEAEQTNMSNLGTRVESETHSDNLAIVNVSYVNVQSDYTMQDGFSEAYENEEALGMKDDGNVGETKFREPYKYPRLLRLSQIRKLARGLNASVAKTASVDAVDEQLVNPHSVLGSGIRLIHVKHLVRAFNSNAGKTCEQKMQGQGNVVRMNDQMTSEVAFLNGAVK